MKKTVLKLVAIIVFLCVGIIPIIAQNTVLEKRISVKLNNVQMEKAVEKIAETAGINVSYSSNLLSDCSRVTIEAQDQMLVTVLNNLFAPYKIAYTVHAGQLILFPKKTMVIKEYTIKGTICSEETGTPISYSTLQIKGKPKGVIADNEGYFEFTLTEMELSDSLTASCVGHERRTFCSEELLSKPEVTIKLKEKPINLESVTVQAAGISKKSKNMGNRSWFTTGSVYLDTHGQQIALYVDNKKQVNGYIRKVSYHLSDKGNVEAPFRVRIFDVDTLNRSPKKDLIPEILVVQPPLDTDGWFDVDVSEYGIYVPSDGFL